MFVELKARLVFSADNLRPDNLSLDARFQRADLHAGFLKFLDKLLLRPMSFAGHVADRVLDVRVEIGAAEIETSRELQLELLIDQFVEHFLTRWHLAGRELQKASPLLDIECGDWIAVNEHNDDLSVGTRARNDQCDAGHDGSCDAAAADSHDVRNIEHGNVHYASNMASAACKLKTARIADRLTDCGGA